MSVEHIRCPRCGHRIEPIEGWREYGDQLVEITVFGCMECGWNEDMDMDDDDDWDDENLGQE
jgi:hypothetical protein